MLRGLTKPTARLGAGLPASLRGALWMGAAAVAFALMVTLVRQLTDGLHPLQVVFFRTAFGLAQTPKSPIAAILVLLCRRFLACECINLGSIRSQHAV